MKKKLVKMLLAAFFLADVAYGMRMQDDKALNVTRFGATPNDETDDRAAIQACIDKAAGSKAAVYIPAGKYIVNGDLWLPSRASIKGDGKTSLLEFKSGALRMLKNGSKDFSYTDNYNNEIVPGQQVYKLSAPAKSGASSIQLESAGNIAAGTMIYVYNNKSDSWTVLEDKSKTAAWNDPATEMARKELFIVKSKNGNTLVLDRPLKFSYQQGAVAGLQLGAQDVTISDLALSNHTAPYAVMFEQARTSIIKNLDIDANGGIMLSHMAYRCRILNCKIRAAKGRGILVENFSAENEISNNVVDYTSGGDAAIMILMSSSNNTIAGNKVTGHGNKEADEGGIFIHALCYGNKVHDNTIRGTSEGVGAYYGAMDNQFYNNDIRGVRVGIMSYYARNNAFNKNNIVIQTARKGNAVGALVFSSAGIGLSGNTISGSILFGIQLQASNACEVADNNIQGVSADKYSFGIKVIPAKNNGKANQLKNNRIDKVKTKTATE
jgi:parallel beta-helix repeat protein